MKTTAKIQKIGSGHYISVPVQVRRLLNLKANSIVEIDLKKPDDNNIRSYECIVCLYNFDMNPNEEEIYCPCCNNDDIETIREVIKID